MAAFFASFTERVQRALKIAQAEASASGRGYVGTEHLLLGIMHDPGAAGVILDDFTIDEVRNSIFSLIGHGDEKPALGGAHSDEAAAQKLKLVDFMEDETTVEGVLRAQGFKDAICTVHDDSCNVMVRAASLTDAQSAQILSVASAQTGLSPANIKIIPVP